jgi:hypothetical protein
MTEARRKKGMMALKASCIVVTKLRTLSLTKKCFSFTLLFASSSAVFFEETPDPSDPFGHLLDLPGIGEA